MGFLQSFRVYITGNTKYDKMVLILQLFYNHHFTTFGTSIGNQFIGCSLLGA